MSEAFTLSTLIPGVDARRLFQAWLDSAGHSAFTGSPAVIDPRPGGTFTAWDGYIQGTTLEAQPYSRIVQSWRTTEFPPDSPDSRLEVLFEDEAEGARITLIHTGIPEGQGEDYRQGWEDYYFAPLREYFRP